MLPESTPNIPSQPSTSGANTAGSPILPTTPPQQPQQTLDPDVQTFTQAIAMQEGGGKLLPYDATGGSGETGRYQFMPDTWHNYAQQVLGNQNAPMTAANQNQVAYTKFKQWHDAGYTWAQMASMWNAGEGAPNAYQSGGTGTNAEGVAYNTPQYVKNVQKYAQQLSSGQQLPQAPTGNDASAQINGLTPPPTPGTPTNTGSVQIPGLSLPPPPPTQASPASTQAPAPNADPSGGFLQGLGEDLTGTNPDSLGDQIGNTLSGAGNFLFPIAGDVYNDVTGKNKKTALQQLGDAGTSALGVASLIPGADVVADPLEAARGADIAATGSADIAKSGILQKLLSSETLKGAGTGYAYGTAQNLAQGQSLGQAVAPNASNLIGAASGGALGAVVPRLGGLARDIAGISPGMANDLGNVGNVDDYNQYVNAAKTRAQYGARMPSPLNLAADQLDNASDQIQSKISTAGQAVGDAKKAGGAIRLKSVTNPTTGEVSSVNQVAKDFSDRVASDYGLNLKVQNGSVIADPIAGRSRQLASSEISRIENAYQQLLSLKGGTGNVRKATDIMANLDDLVDYSKTDQIGVNHDPLEGLLKNTRGNLNNVVRNSAPDLANANDRFSQLKGLDKEIGGMAGKNLQKGELLMKRVFSGDKSGDVNDLFQKIKDETGIDLVNHAVLAKHAIDSFGDSSQKSLLQQAIEGGVEAHTGGIIPSLMKMGAGVARATFANPETIGRNIVRGKSSGILPRLLINQGAHAGARVGAAVSQ